MDEFEDFNPFQVHLHHGEKDFFGTNSKGRRSFSTSTPIVSKADSNTSRRSSSVSLCSLNDSGYAESICSFASSEDFSTDITSSIEAPILHIGSDTGYRSGSGSSVLPAFAVKKTEQQSNTNRLSSDFSFHTLDYEIPEEENVIEKFSPQKSINIPRYSLDLKDLEDEFMSNCDIEREARSEHLPDCFNKVLENFQPQVPDRLIGRKIALENVDILSELQDRSMTAINSMILDYVSPEDLCSMCQVSQRWREMCDAGRHKSRKTNFLKSRINRLPGKENSYKKVIHKARRLTGVGNSLSTIQFVPDSQILEEPVCKQPCRVGTHRDSFMKAAESLKNDERLQKCPSCQHPSKVLPVQERGTCLNQNCGFDYCVKCFSEYHGSQPCVPVGSGRTKTASIGGKKSKKNLRRL